MRYKEQKISPVLIVVAGPNGSGKTTLINQLVQHQWGKKCFYINPDEIAQKKFGDWNNIEAVRRAAKLATKMRYECLRKRRDFMFETVFSTEEKLNFLKEAKKEGFFIRFFYICLADPTLNAMRVARRVMQGGHTVPIEKIIERYYRSLRLAREAVRIVDRAYLYDNSKEFAPAKLFIRLADGQIEKVYDRMPEWASGVIGGKDGKSRNNTISSERRRRKRTRKSAKGV